jgi:transcriptional activator of cad operon
MDRPTLIVGEWQVDPAAGQICRDGSVVRVDARLMRLLMCLAQRAGELVTTDELLAEVWSGVVVTQDSVYQGVASLRRVLGDEPRQPRYIATVPRRGYRLIAAVERLTDAPAARIPASTPAGAAVVHAQAASADPLAAAAPASAATAGASILASASGASAAVPAETSRRWRLGLVLGAGALLCLAQAASVDPGATPPAWRERSVAVLPFLDLTTESMDQEYFADGLTEELIDDLSRVPGLKVPSATASFHFKGKQMTVANIAKDLGVAYIVDGSLRKAGTTLRVAVRLVQADNGFVVWSGTYDRESDNVLTIQGDVANEVTQALKAKLRDAPTRP